MKTRITILVLNTFRIFFTIKHAEIITQTLKRPFTFWLIVLLLFSTQPIFSFPSNSGNSCEKLEGVWEYDLPDLKGLLFIDAGHLLSVLVPIEKKEYLHGQPTQQEKASAMEASLFGFVSLECSGNQAIATYLYSKDPGEIGKVFRFEFSVANDQLTYQIIHPDGQQEPERVARKVDDMVRTDDACDAHIGFWEYTHEMTGVWAASHSYFAWMEIHREYWNSKPDLNTVEGKAAVFDGMYVGAGRYYCPKNVTDPTEVVLEHDMNYYGEGTHIWAEFNLNGQLQNGWVLDQDKKRTDIKWTSKRLKNKLQ